MRRRKRNVRASRHQRTLRLHPIPRFYSLIPLCSPPGSQGDFYSSLRISTLTSRHPQPSRSPARPPSLPFVPRSISLRLRCLSVRSPLSLLPLARSLSRATLWYLSRSSQQHPPPGTSSPVIRSAPFVTLSATATKAHSLVRISSAVDTSQHRLKNRAYRRPTAGTRYECRDRQVHADGDVGTFAAGIARPLSIYDASVVACAV